MIPGEGDGLKQKTTLSGSVESSSLGSPSFPQILRGSSSDPNPSPQLHFPIARPVPRGPRTKWLSSVFLGGCPFPSVGTWGCSLQEMRPPKDSLAGLLTAGPSAGGNSVAAKTAPLGQGWGGEKIVGEGNPRRFRAVQLQEGIRENRDTSRAHVSELRFLSRPFLQSCSP